MILTPVGPELPGDLLASVRLRWGTAYRSRWRLSGRESVPHPLRPFPGRQAVPILSVQRPPETTSLGAQPTFERGCRKRRESGNRIRREVILYLCSALPLRGF